MNLSKTGQSLSIQAVYGWWAESTEKREGIDRFRAERNGSAVAIPDRIQRAMGSPVLTYEDIAP